MSDHRSLFPNSDGLWPSEGHPYPRLPAGAILGDSMGIDDPRHRYALHRRWDPLLPPTIWIMLNPSTADGMTDDNTIRKCCKYARAWGAGGIVVVNLYSLRATDPDVIAAAPRAVRNGIYADAWITMALRLAAHHRIRPIAAWGAKVKAIADNRRGEVLEAAARLEVALDALHVTQDLHPGHPLYLRDSLKPRQYTTASGAPVEWE